MNLVLQLNAETESLLNESAARAGQTPVAYAMDAIQEKLAAKRAACPHGLSVGDLDAVAKAWSWEECPLDRLSLQRNIRAAQEIAEELGFHFREYQVECDPSEPRRPWIDLLVIAPPELTNILDKQLRWHDRLEEVVGVEHAYLRIRIDDASA